MTWLPSSGRREVSVVRPLAPRSDIGEDGLTGDPILRLLVGVLRGGREPAEAAHQEQPHGAADLIPPWPGAHCCQDDLMKSPSDRCQGRMSHHPLSLYPRIFQTDLSHNVTTWSPVLFQNTAVRCGDVRCATGGLLLSEGASAGSSPDTGAPLVSGPRSWASLHHSLQGGGHVTNMLHTHIRLSSGSHWHVASAENPCWMKTKLISYSPILMILHGMKVRCDM